MRRPGNEWKRHGTTTTFQSRYNPFQTPAVTTGESALSKEETFNRIRQTVDWLRRPVYLDDYSTQFKSGTESVAGLSLRKAKFDERTLAEQVEATFQEVQVPADKLRHPTKAHLTAVEVLPIVPSFQLWGNEYSHVVFEEAQAIDEKGNQIKIKTRKEEKAKAHDQDAQDFAIIKGGYQDSINTCVTHYVPAAEKPRETLSSVNVGDEHHFHWDTEYDFHLKSLYDPAGTRHLDWCLIEDPETGAISYNMLVQHFRLSKRKALERKREEERRRFLPTGGMHLTYRDMSAEEHEKLEQRKAFLEPQVYDDDMLEKEGPLPPPELDVEDSAGAAGLNRLPSEEGEATPAAMED